MKARRSILASLVACALVSSCAGVGPLSDEAVKAKFAKTFNNVEIDKVGKSEVAGIYEIYAGGRIMYYAPKDDVVIFGELYSIGGTSLTQAKADEYLKARAASIDKSKAIVVGEGNVEVLAFVDPDCGYCAMSEKWFESRNYANTRLLVYFQALDPMSPGYQRALQLACAPVELRREAMRRVFQRGSDPAAAGQLACAEGKALLAEHAQIAKKAGVGATPVFVVGGQTVVGFQQDRLASLIDGPVVSLKQ